MNYLVEVTGVLVDERTFDARFLVPAATEHQALRAVHTQYDWSDAKTVCMAATMAPEASAEGAPTINDRQTQAPST